MTDLFKKYSGLFILATVPLAAIVGFVVKGSGWGAVYGGGSMIALFLGLISVVGLSDAVAGLFEGTGPNHQHLVPAQFFVLLAAVAAALTGLAPAAKGAALALGVIGVIGVIRGLARRKAR